uniref:Uncharacterized protein n=1 Tax=Mustela putorius furo TaxID=9669 RepID=M3Z2F7_MUSPF
MERTWCTEETLTGRSQPSPILAMLVPWCELAPHQHPHGDTAGPSHRPFSSSLSRDTRTTWAQMGSDLQPWWVSWRSKALPHFFPLPPTVLWWGWAWRTAVQWDSQ